MATIRKRGEFQWEAQIRRKGYPAVSMTFEIKVDAEDWARDLERDMRRGVFIDRRESETTTLKKVLEKYSTEVTVRKKSKVRETSRINKLLDHKLAGYSLAGIKAKDIAEFRDAGRKRGLAENTVRLDIALLSAVFEQCRKEWGIEVDNPCRKIKLPGGSKKRERRLSTLEESSLLEFIVKALPRTKYTRELIELDIETGMRQSEILGIEWSDVKLSSKSIHLDDTKSGDPREVPLSPRAIQIIQSMPRPITNCRVFDLSQDRLIRGFKLACKLAREAAEKPKAGFMENLKFHDLRHESASRWGSILNAQELCKMFGWKTMQMALRYYHPTALSIADKLIVDVVTVQHITSSASID
jgi:integrase